MLVLCPFVMNGSLFAQLHLSSSSTYNSYSTSDTYLVLPTLEFQSTSTYGRFIKREREYTTAPMYVANGTIKTVASSIRGGVLTNNEGYILHEGGKDQGAVIAGVPDLSLGDGWDVGIFLALLSMAYLLYVKRKDKQTITAKI